MSENPGEKRLEVSRGEIVKEEKGERKALVIKCGETKAAICHILNICDSDSARDYVVRVSGCEADTMKAFPSHGNTCLQNTPVDAGEQSPRVFSHG